MIAAKTGKKEAAAVINGGKHADTGCGRGVTMRTRKKNQVPLSGKFPCMVIECESDEDVQILKRELQKHKPMKPFSGENICPFCECEVGRGNNYCPMCGQALDWS